MAELVEQSEPDITLAAQEDANDDSMMKTSYPPQDLEMVAREILTIVSFSPIEEIRETMQGAKQIIEYSLCLPWQAHVLPENFTVDLTTTEGRVRAVGQLAYLVNPREDNNFKVSHQCYSYQRIH